jgi:transposase
MFFPEGRIRVHLYGQPCDMRKGFDGLSALVRNALGRDPMDGSLYVYVNRKATQMRVLYFDRSGYCVWGKRLEAGKVLERLGRGMHARDGLDAVEALDRRDRDRAASKALGFTLFAVKYIGSQRSGSPYHSVKYTHAEQRD